MDSAMRAAFIQWADERSGRLDGGDSHGSCSPPVVKCSTPTTAQRGLPAPTPDPMIPKIAGRGQDLLPPSLSDLSLRSASSGTSWQSPSSTSSRKHSLEPPFDGSSKPKRHQFAEMDSAAASFRYSAPCAQSILDIDRSERRRGGLLRRSGAPIQSCPTAGPNDTILPPIDSYFGSEWEKPGGAGGHSLLGPFYPPRPSHQASGTSAPLEKQEARKMKEYSLWRLTSPPTVEPTIPESDRGEAASSNMEVGLPRPESSPHATQTSTGQPGYSSRLHSHTGPQWLANADVEAVEDERAARLGALHTLEGTHRGDGSAQGDNSRKTNNPSEGNPIIMCVSQMAFHEESPEQVRYFQKDINPMWAIRAHGYAPYEIARPYLQRRGLSAVISVPDAPYSDLAERHRCRYSSATGNPSATWAQEEP
ncbi:hypothetical protein C8A00DRAFT_33590 [Chaetomidium leptoderma]|uniref:Uncharacterized protein n=1 Tax=Chaetomidium leptoderma TaxID=669021 RepID=A0AAN6VLS9_9PEZI|nr:hypothetical protein C8A00DRAFT_33590 [Chaetomidium leptoderma]